MTPNTESTPLSPRLVTVIVGSDISELRSEPARARATRSVRSSISSSSGFSATSWMAGATRPPPRSEIATPTWVPVAGSKWSSRQNPLNSPNFGRASATALSCSTAGRIRSVIGRPAFCSVSQSSAVSRMISSAR